MNEDKAKPMSDCDYPYGKPENDLLPHLKVLHTYFNDDFGEALTEMDNKAISFYLQYVKTQLQGTRYTEWTPTRDELDELKESVRKLVMNSDADTLKEEKRQQLEDWVNKEGQFSHEREERIDSGGTQ